MDREYSDSLLEHEYIFQEIVEQAAIARLQANAPAPAWPDSLERVVLSGAGDSLAACELIAAVFPDAPLEALPILRGSEVARTLGPGDVLVGVSVSGRTPRVLEAARRARARGAATVAVTDDPGSPLAGEAEKVWLIGASPAPELRSTDYSGGEAQDYVGYHHDVAQTKSFFAAVLTLARAARSRWPGAEALDGSALAAQVEAAVSGSARAAFEAHVPGLAEAGQTFFLAGATGLPVARFAAYKSFEFNRAAHFSDVEEYCHTHYFMTRPGDAVVALLDDDAGVNRAREVLPVLAELFDARVLAVRSEGVDPLDAGVPELAVPSAPTRLARALALVTAAEWITYLVGRVGAPDINTFHAGYDAERLVAASMRTIRRSRIEAD